jgi:hypothetical protein
MLGQGGAGKCYSMAMLQGAAFRILACYYNQDLLNFVDLCESAGYPTDLGGYYIRQLVKGGYIGKEERGQYRILPKGKQHLAVYYGKQLFASRPRLAIVVVAKKGEAFIGLRRKVQPFVGVAEWPATAVEHGESLEAAAQRAIKSRLYDQERAVTLVGFFRRIDLYGNTVFDDKLFAVFTAALPDDAQLLLGGPTGDNILCTEQELYKLENPGKSLLDIFEYAKAGKSGICERTYSLLASDLSLPD